MKYISILIGLKYSVLKKNNFTYLNDIIKKLLFQLYNDSKTL